jgi:hypothetical protein
METTVSPPLWRTFRTSGYCIERDPGIWRIFKLFFKKGGKKEPYSISDGHTKLETTASNGREIVFAEIGGI